MFKVTEETLEKAHKPFDLVSTPNGSVGFIQETSVNSCQASPEHQISYSVHWLIGKETKSSWWSTDELLFHGNLFIEIAKCMVHPMSDSAKYVQSLFNNINH